MQSLFPIQVAVAGVSWHQDVVSSARVGDRVWVVAEPDNPFDANALRVDLEWGTAGHLPKAVAAQFAKDGIADLHGVVCACVGSDIAGLRVELYRSDDGTATTCETEVPAAPVRVTPEVGEDAPLVRVRHSGRVLGRLIALEDERVRVLASSGAEVAYPASAVEFGDS